MYIVRCSKWIFLLALLLTQWSCKKELTTYSSSGAIFEIFEINKDSLKHGSYIRYYDNGKIAETSQYINGLQEGLRTLYYDNGNKESESVYKGGKMNGKHYVYYSTGELKVSCEYVDNETVGVFKMYYINGQVKEEVNFANDMENGPFTEYYSNGKLKAKGQYLNGDHEFGVIEMYDSTGVLQRKIECDSLKICKTIWIKDSLDIQ